MCFEAASKPLLDAGEPNLFEQMAPSSSQSLTSLALYFKDDVTSLMKSVFIVEV